MLNFIRDYVNYTRLKLCPLQLQEVLKVVATGLQTSITITTAWVMLVPSTLVDATLL